MVIKETPRDLALRVLSRLSPDAALPSDALDRVFRSEPGLDERDRAFLSHLVLGVLRWRLRLDWIIEKNANFPLKRIDPAVLDILRLSLYQIFFMDRVPDSASVDEAVKQAKRSHSKHVVSFVNGILRNICRRKDAIPFPDPEGSPVLFLSRFHSYPEWLVQKYLGLWGMEFTEELLAAGNQIPGLVVRANILKISPADLLKELEGEGVRGRPALFSPQGIVLEDFRGRVDQLSSFKRGLFQVQDEAAQVTSLLLAPKRGQKVLDLCAGLGGKTTHMAELMGDQGGVIALDLIVGRLVSLKHNLARLGMKRVFPVGGDASGNLSSLFRHPFDRVLIDAPCSGLGVISRHPDGKWARTESDIHRLAALQKKIVSQAAPLVRKGGRMLYVTCTLTREENEGVVSHCLQTHRDLSLVNLKAEAPEWAQALIDEQGFFRTFPNQHPMDGFFAALFVKN
jgi:16S rRNA (cytosine967-C5)-methyltransferase